MVVTGGVLTTYRQYAGLKKAKIFKQQELYGEIALTGRGDETQKDWKEDNSV